MLVDGCLVANTPIETALALKDGPNIVIDFASAEPERKHIDTSALPSRGQILAHLLAGNGKGLPAAPGPHSVLMRSLMLNRPDHARDIRAHDILLTPPVPADAGPLDWHRHRELRSAAREYARAELTRLAAQGHALLTRPPRQQPIRHSS